MSALYMAEPRRAIQPREADRLPLARFRGRCLLEAFQPWLYRGRPTCHSAAFSRARSDEGEKKGTIARTEKCPVTQVDVRPKQMMGKLEGSVFCACKQPETARPTKREAEQKRKPRAALPASKLNFPCPRLAGSALVWVSPSQGTAHGAQMQGTNTRNWFERTTK